jgi:hypothetical protein
MNIAIDFMSELKQKVLGTLNQLAINRSTISYRNLADCLQVSPPGRIQQITKILETLIIEDHRLNKPLMSALVTGRNGLPGQGFFQICRKIGRYFGPDNGPQAIFFYELEKESVYDSIQI